MKCSFFFFGLATLFFCLSPHAENDWRIDANQRIEQVRKGELVVRVLDKAGKPIRGVPVKASMTRHAFPWGTCVTAAHITGSSSGDEIYREHLKGLFNCAVLENDLKWNAWHGAWGKGYKQERTHAALVWLKEHGFRIRGHCMVYPGWEHFQPQQESLKNDLPLLRTSILQHIDALAVFTREYVDEWDVVNEPVHYNEITQALGEGAMAEWFSRARSTLPASCRLFINEFNVVEPDDISVRARYEELIAGLLAAGAPVEGVGFQSHFHNPPESVEDALAVFDAFSRFGLPIVVTEFDVNIKDEEKQAAFIRDFMTAAFSHPACAGFVFWGFWEGAHWRPDGAMFRKDWSEKPNLAVYRDLVFNEWWTDVEGVTDSKGEFAMRGFKGSYKVIVGKNEQCAAIGDKPTTVEIFSRE